MSEIRPFEDQEEVDKVNNERDQLIASLSNFMIPDDERRFILRKINIITERLLHHARYAKDAKDI